MKTQMALVITTVLLATQAWAAPTRESGAGRNGPDQSGISIPVQIDRGLKLRDFQQAVVNCTQDLKRSVLEQLLRQRVNEIAVPQDYPYMAFVRVNGKLINIWAKAGVYLNPAQNASPQPTMGFEAGLMEGYVGKLKVPEYTADSEVLEMLEAAQGSYAQFFQGVKVVYETLTDSQYDELKNINYLKALVVNYTVTSTPFARWDGNSLKETNIKYSATKFAQCLQNQIN